MLIRNSWLLSPGGVPKVENTAGRKTKETTALQKTKRYQHGVTLKLNMNNTRRVTVALLAAKSQRTARRRVKRVVECVLAKKNVRLY